ncbi:MAG: alpha-L-fucosidase [Armatimonadetes bacterium]|nr:alpha-L-fucosidase [Armatimonadota bacterium]
MSDHPIPSPKQLAWQEMQFGMFCHFGPNTFADQEWGEGDDDPAVFNPTDLSPDQWASVAADAGMKYLVVTTKHHDGFCLWPTDTTDYSVASSPCDADVIELVAQACRDRGLKLGLYCSPWDRHEPRYDDAPAYDRHFAAQWTELLTRYGEVSYVWLDGAGSQGHVYDWELIIGTIREHAPEACIFSMGEPDVRWVGNEDGLAPDPCWNVVETPHRANNDHFLPDYRESFPHWLPAECDARIRANWFWHDHDLPTLKSLERLVHMYYNSVGRGCNLLLNVAPDTRGLLPESDVDRLVELAAELRRRFGSPLGEAVGPAERLQVDFDRPTPVNHAIIREDIAQGERVRQFRVMAQLKGRWEGVHVGTAIGAQRIVEFPTVVADAVAVHVDRADDEAQLKELWVFYC